MSTFHQRKAERREYFQRFVNGWKQRSCSSCSGSGYYDHAGSPPCGACAGSGRERFRPPAPPPPNHAARSRGETSAQDRRLLLDYYSQPGVAIPKYRKDLDDLRPLVDARRAQVAADKAESWAARRPMIRRM